MIRFLLLVEAASLWLVLASVLFVMVMMAVILVERIALARHAEKHHRFEQQYGPVVAGALSGDAAARRVLAALPQRARIRATRLVILPLVDDRDAARVAAARELTRGMRILPLAEAYLNSVWWWRRVLALRVFGLIQDPDHTDRVIAALDDRHPDVRGAALDALADLQDPAALPAIAARMLDETLPRGGRAAAVQAFGSQCEAFVLDRADIDRAHRSNYARILTLCGTARARPLLCEWMADRRADVRIASLQALAHVGLDDGAASAALVALESPILAERAMAAAALQGWTGSRDAAARLAAHLGDSWPVAVNAARALRSMAGAGRVELETCAARYDLAGLLARQMLWESDARC